MNQINHVIPPNKLILGWQPASGKRRTLYLVGELCQQDNTFTLAYLTNTADFKNASLEGFDGYPAFKNTALTYSEGVLDAFMRRLPPQTRADFPNYLQTLRLQAVDMTQPFTLLGYAGAKLPNDGYCLIHPFDTAKAPFEFVTEVAGFRFYQEHLAATDYQEGNPVNLLFEKDNIIDNQAIKITSKKGRCLGYVHRGHLPLFHRILNQHKVIATIDRIHTHPRRPVMYLFIKVT